MAEERTQSDEQIFRTEVRPGLVMLKRVTKKPDGRYLIYYDFERPGGPTDGPGCAAEGPAG